MAAIIPRGKNNDSFAVVYMFDGKQKWETFPTKAAADARKLEIEYQQSKKIFVPPNFKLVKDFLAEYVEVYGTAHWKHSAFNTNTGLIRNYINPNIGNWKMKDIDIKKMDRFFTDLKKQEAVRREGHKKVKLISSRTVFEINRLLSVAFDCAHNWGYIGKNPITKTACPKRPKSKKRDIWNPDEALKAFSLCEDLNLLTCMHISTACTMRMGEITGLKWEFVHFGDVENNFEGAFLYVDAQLRRITVEAYNKLQQEEEVIKFIFPSTKKSPKTMVVLMTPKTESSERTVWIPPTAAAVLFKLKQAQDELKQLLGDEYIDYGLVITHPNGKPIEGTKMDEYFGAFISENKLPKVEFHSLRHLSTTVKLTISKGDIKSVQGDTGHATAQMVTEQYAKILDQNRKMNAQKFEEEFYGGKTEKKPVEIPPEQLIAQCLSNPDALNMLRSLLGGENPLAGTESA
jgi:integrase